MQSVHSRNEGSDKVIGYLFALPYWLCEHTSLLEPIKSSEFPGLVKWNLKGLNNALQQNPLITLHGKPVILSELNILDLN